MTDAYSDQPWSRWISNDTVAMLYKAGIQRWGGSESSAQIGCVEAALGAAYNAELYTPESEQEGFIPGLLFACYLLFYLATKHCYVDGNKRIAWAGMAFVLLNFGLTLGASDEDAETFCLQVASGQIENGTAVASWIYPRLMPVT